MSWFQSTNLASFAKTALKEAQKTIDKALEISENPQSTETNDKVNAVTEAASDFFASWGVGLGGRKGKEDESEGDGVERKEESAAATAVTEEPHQQEIEIHKQHGHPLLLVDLQLSTPSNPTAASIPKQLEQEQPQLVMEHGRSLSDTIFNSSTLHDSLVLLDEENVSEVVDASSSGDKKQGLVSPLIPSICDDPTLSPPPIIDSTSSKDIPVPTPLLSDTLEGDLTIVDLNSPEPPLEPIEEKERDGTVEVISDVIFDSNSWSWTDALPQPQTAAQDQPAPTTTTPLPTKGKIENEGTTVVQVLQDSHLGSSTVTVLEEGQDVQGSKEPTQYEETESAASLSPLPPPLSPPIASAAPFLSATEDELLPHHQEDTHEPIKLEKLELVGLSSRGSSIGVVSRLCSTRASSGGSDDPIIDESTHSSSYEKVDPLSSAPTSPTSQFGCHHHKKGPSSSSSDIEVILFSELGGGNRRSSSGGSCNTDHSHSHPISIEQQTSMELQDAQTQTDVVVAPAPPPATHNTQQESEKDEIICELRQEGEKLSKKQFEQGQLIKKLRGKEKEYELLVATLKGELAGKSLENERLSKAFIGKEGKEKALQDKIAALQKEKRELELNLSSISSELEDAKENSSTMKAAVEDASVEILELKNAILLSQRDSTEMDNLRRDKAELTSRNEGLQKELDSLRSTMTTIQDRFSSRESLLLTELSNLSKRNHELQCSLGDVSSEVADATMPLSLQIEKLEKELKGVMGVMATQERTLLSQLGELESKYKGAREKETALKNENILLQSTLSQLSSQRDSLALEVERLKGAEEEKRGMVQGLLDKISKLEGELGEWVAQVGRMKEENEGLGKELREERALQELEKRKALERKGGEGPTTTTNTNNNNNSKRSGGNSPNSPTPCNSVTSESSYLEEVFGEGTHRRSMTPRSSLYEGFHPSSGFLESLQAQLRLKETELSQAQEEIFKNEKIRKSLNEEIARLTLRNHECRMEIERLGELGPRLEELEKTYNALLQMYGEKVEEVEELRMDLQDVTQIYKTQIDQLVKR